ncbi:MAG: molecular chaperone DnaJ [Planctomycetaceae bacterium]|nr:molecular chaperone DnaJ [Planctomycetaceae bacterium]
MVTKRDYYEVLGVERSAGERAIATSYRKLAIKYHPDSNSGDSEAVEQFKEAAEAYEVLSDPEKRARYDRYGHAGVAGSTGQFNQVEDIFEAFGDIFGTGLFGDLLGGRRGRRQRRGADIRCDVTLDLEEAAENTVKTVTFSRSRPCDPCDGKGTRPGSSLERCRRCGGEGQVAQQMGFVRVQTTCPSCEGSGMMIADPCTDCGGAGRVAGTVTIDIAIPGGIDDGMRVRIPGEGEPGPDGGPPGDCYCFVSVRPHELFQRDGQHLVLRLPISYSQATLGAKVEVPTLSGSTELTIPKGTQAGQVFRLRSKGMPDPRGGGRRGELLVQTYIEVPTKLGRNQRELLQKLAELERTEVTPERKSFVEKLRDYLTGEDPPEKASE